MPAERPTRAAYIPISREPALSVGDIDGASRAVLAWRLSNTRDTSFCVATLEEALARFEGGNFNTVKDWGQFPSGVTQKTIDRLIDWRLKVPSCAAGPGGMPVKGGGWAPGKRSAAL